MSRDSEHKDIGAYAGKPIYELIDMIYAENNEFLHSDKLDTLMECLYLSVDHIDFMCTDLLIGEDGKHASTDARRISKHILDAIRGNHKVSANDIIDIKFPDEDSNE